MFTRCRGMLCWSSKTDAAADHLEIVHSEPVSAFLEEEVGCQFLDGLGRQELYDRMSMASRIIWEWTNVLGAPQNVVRGP